MLLATPNQLLMVRQRHNPQPSVEGIPPLESGDRLTRIEFERRYLAAPCIKKAELDGEYRLLPVNKDGIIRSQVFPGLWLASALLTGELPEVLGVLQQGLSSPEHAAFVKRLDEVNSL